MKKKIISSFLIILSVFVGLFFILHEMLGIKNSLIIIFSTILISAGLIFAQKNFNVSSYILLPVIILDGFFHLTSPLENLIENSPDWVIAFNFFGGNGMPVIVHQLMGVFLLATSLIFIYYLILKRKDLYYYFYKYLVATITMTIISISYMIKLFSP